MVEASPSPTRMTSLCVQLDTNEEFECVSPLDEYEDTYYNNPDSFTPDTDDQDLPPSVPYSLPDPERLMSAIATFMMTACDPNFDWSQEEPSEVDYYSEPEIYIPPEIPPPRVVPLVRDYRYLAGTQLRSIPPPVMRVVPPSHTKL